MAANDLPALGIRRPLLVLVLNLLIALAGLAAIFSVEVRDLPDAVEQLTVYKAEEDADPVLTIAVLSDRLSEDELTRVIERDIVPELIAIDGVADVPLFGNRQRQLRVVVDPLRLTSFCLSVTDVAEVLRNAPFDVPAGSFSSDDQELLVRADASVVTTAQVEAIIVRGTMRIGDIADVHFGPEDASSFVRLDGRAVIGLGVVRQAQSNTIEERLPELSEPRISYQPTQPQLSVEIDRRRAADLGIPLDGLAATLRAMIDGDELVDLNVADDAIGVRRSASRSRPQCLRGHHHQCPSAAAAGDDDPAVDGARRPAADSRQRPRRRGARPSAGWCSAAWGWRRCSRCS